VAARISLGIVALGAVAVGLAWGWGALGVYLFLALVAGALTFGASLGGGWLTGASRGRFDRGTRRRS
jgi:hypothetical protein